MESYSTRCLFEWEPRDGQKKAHLYEERITLWQAESADEAIEMAEREAKAYAGEDSTFLDVCQSYWLVDPVAASGVEVFSLLRESDLEPDAYINAFFETGDEHQRND
ncbi:MULTISPECIES: hypothetical protein [Variovorax]|uniref:hypothetical protein n=1 Tax=Variovorax TaxID=34072 RepID=UPI000364EC3F|nr:hypothetical protein [Variovorax paradoxus]